MIQASIYGRLGRDPETRATKTGKPMVTASLAVDVARDGDEETLWVSVMAFGRCAEALERHQKGDMIGAMGRLTRGHYAGKDGQERESWSLLADALHSSRTVRPGGPPRKSAGTTRASGPATGDSEPFHDEVPF